MKDSKRDIRVYLRDIFESIDRIEQYTIDMTIDEFDDDLKTKDAVIRCLQVVGEAVKNIPDDFRTNHSDIPWREVTGMRDVLVHEYAGINADMLWEVIRRDAPELKEKIKLLLEEIQRSG